MSDELRVCAAAFLRNKGKTTVTDNEFLMGVSMDFHWMPYGDAKKLLSAMIQEGVFVKSGEYLRPTFEISEVDVPVAYRPSEGILKSCVAKPKADPAQKNDADLLPSLMAEAMESGMEKRDFISECNILQKRLNIDILAAGLIVLRDRGVKVSDFSEKIYEAVSKK